MPNDTVIIVGARSILGYALAKEAAHRVESTTDVVLTSRQWEGAPTTVWQELGRMIHTKQLTPEFLNRASALFFLPGLTSLDRFETEGVDSALEVFHLFRALLVQLPPTCPVVLASAGGVYGDTGTARPSEGDPISFDSRRAQSIYPATKAFLEVQLARWAAQHEGPAIVARIFHTFGNFSRATDNRSVAGFIRDAAEGRIIRLNGNYLQQRCFGYAGDVAQALFALTTVEAPERTTIVNVAASRNVMSVADFANAVADVFESRVEFGEQAFSDAQNPSQALIPDTSLLDSLVSTTFGTVNEGLLRVRDAIGRTKTTYL